MFWSKGNLWLSVTLCLINDHFDSSEQSYLPYYHFSDAGNTWLSTIGPSRVGQKTKPATISSSSDVEQPHHHHHPTLHHSMNDFFYSDPWSYLSGSQDAAFSSHFLEIISIQSSSTYNDSKNLIFLLQNRIHVDWFLEYINYIHASYPIWYIFGIYLVYIWNI